MSILPAKSRFDNFVDHVCNPTVPERRITRIQPDEFRISKKESVAQKVFAASPDPEKVTILVQNLLRFAKYKHFDLQREFSGVNGKVKYQKFRDNLDFLIGLTGGRYVLSEKKTKLLDSLIVNKDDVLKDLDDQIKCIKEASLQNPDLEDALIYLELRREQIANDPLFSINQLHRAVLREYQESEGQEAMERVSPAPRLDPDIQNIVISGGGAKGAVLPAAFRSMMKLAPGILDNAEEILGSSVGAITAALAASGISRETLKEIGGVDFQKLLGASLINKDGEDLKLFLRQGIRVNILLRLNQMSPEVRQQFEAAPMGRLIIEQLSLPLEQSKITFGMLGFLRQLDPAHFKDLTITATLKEGGQLIFDKERTPDVDIALACRASASIPIVFKPVELELEGQVMILFDGGLIDNVPVAIIEAKKPNPQDHTLVMVFEEEVAEGESSVFDPTNPAEPYVPSSKDRFLRNWAATMLTGLRMEKPNTECKAEVLEKIKKEYPHTISFAVDLKTTQFSKASNYPEKYAHLGKETMKHFLMMTYGIVSPK